MHDERELTHSLVVEHLLGHSGSFLAGRKWLGVARHHSTIRRIAGHGRGLKADFLGRRWAFTKDILILVERLCLRQRLGLSFRLVQDDLAASALSLVVVFVRLSTPALFASASWCPTGNGRRRELFRRCKLTMRLRMRGWWWFWSG